MPMGNLGSPRYFLLQRMLAISGILACQQLVFLLWQTHQFFFMTTMRWTFSPYGYVPWLTLILKKLANAFAWNEGSCYICISWCRKEDNSSISFSVFVEWTWNSISALSVYVPFVIPPVSMFWTMTSQF